MAQQRVVTVDDITRIDFSPHRLPGCERFAARGRHPTRLLPLLWGPAHGGNRRPSGRLRDPAGPGAPMGALVADSDVLHCINAARQDADLFLTFNTRHFIPLAADDRPRIVAPPDPPVFSTSN